MSEPTMRDIHGLARLAIDVSIRPHRQCLRVPRDRCARLAMLFASDGGGKGAVHPMSIKMTTYKDGSTRFGSSVPAGDITVDVDVCQKCGCLYVDLAKHLVERCEAPEQILNRLATKLGCEPRQVADSVIRMLEERQNGNA